MRPGRRLAQAEGGRGARTGGSWSRSLRPGRLPAGPSGSEERQSPNTGPGPPAPSSGCGLGALLSGVAPSRGRAQGTPPWQPPTHTAAPGPCEPCGRWGSAPPCPQPPRPHVSHAGGPYASQARVPSAHGAGPGPGTRGSSPALPPRPPLGAGAAAGGDDRSVQPEGPHRPLHLERRPELQPPHHLRTARGPWCWARQGGGAGGTEGGRGAGCTRAGGQGVLRGAGGQGGGWAGRPGPRAWLGPWQHSGEMARPWAAQQPGQVCSQVLLWSSSEVWGPRVLIDATWAAVQSLASGREPGLKEPQGPVHPTSLIWVRGGERAAARLARLRPLCLQIDQPTLGMPSREYYFQEGTNQKVSPPGAHRPSLLPPPVPSLPGPTWGPAAPCGLSAPAPQLPREHLRGGAWSLGLGTSFVPIVGCVPNPPLGGKLRGPAAQAPLPPGPSWRVFCVGHVEAGTQASGPGCSVAALLLPPEELTAGPGPAGREEGREHGRGRGGAQSGERRHGEAVGPQSLARVPPSTLAPGGPSPAPAACPPAAPTGPVPEAQAQVPGGKGRRGRPPGAARCPHRPQPAAQDQGPEAGGSVPGQPVGWVSGSWGPGLGGHDRLPAPLPPPP